MDAKHSEPLLPPTPPTQVDVLVVGTGPGAFACATTLRRHGFNVVVVRNGPDDSLIAARTPDEAFRLPHGSDWLPSYAVDLALSPDERAPAVAATATRSAFRVELADHSAIVAKFLVFDTALHPRRGGITPRKGVHFGIPDASKLNASGMVAAVLGGGEAAFQAYAVLRNKGASSVTVYAREIKTRAQLLRRAQDDVVVGDYEVSPDLLEVNGLPFDQIYVMYGHSLAREALLGLMVGLTPRGDAMVDAKLETTCPGVFAIGEMTGVSVPGPALPFAQGQLVAHELQMRLDSGFVAATARKSATKVAAAP